MVNKFLLAALLISLLASGFVLISLGNFGMAQKDTPKSTHDTNPNKPADTPKPTHQPNPNKPTPEPSETPKPTNEPNPNKPTPDPTETPKPTHTPNPNKPADTPKPTHDPTSTPKPIETPKPTHEPNPNKPTPSPTTEPTPSQLPFPTPTPSPSQSKFKISGFIIDSEGHGIAGAEIIFCVPTIVPSVYSNSLGYYAIYAPEGVYHVDVWPPFDSNYIFYDEPAFAVGSDIAKNITLLSGYKVSGYITDSSGTPYKGALVSLDSFFCGWYSNYMGRYFVTAPPGTYTLNLRAKPGVSPCYSECDFLVDGNIIKNMSLGGPSSPPSSTPMPVRNYSSASISIVIDAKFLAVGSTAFVTGRLSDQNGSPLADKTVILSFAVDSSVSWFQVGSDRTNAAGEYTIQWVIGSSGVFTLKVDWVGDSKYLAAYNSTTLTFETSKNASG